MTSDLTPFANDPAAATALGFMHDGKWRKARDAAKDLCKKDRERYQPLLVAANVGLAREMIGKGLLKDAAMVIDYLATIVPVEKVAALRAELEKPALEAASAGGGDAQWALALWTAEGMAAGKGSGPAGWAMIDALVTDGFHPPKGAGEAAERLAAELETVRTACAATGDGRWDEARDALRRLPRESIFQHWRMFLRGTRCVFEDDREMARKCFAELPPEGALARAARALEPSLIRPGAHPPIGARVPFFLAATGQPSAWGAGILEAEASWRAGKMVKTYHDLCRGLKGVFPDDQPGLPGVLTASVLPFLQNMGDRDLDDFDELLHAISKSDGFGPIATELTVARGAAVACPATTSPSYLEKTWRSVLGAFAKRDGPNAVREAVGWHWLGEVLIKGEMDDPFRAPPDFRRARKALELAVKNDPKYLDAWLSLLDLFSKERDSSGHNRLLGELVKRFPHEKRVLVLAGREALARKTYTKALKALREALAMDPLDRELKASIVTALLGQASESRKKNKPTTAFWEEMRPLLEDRAGGEHVVLARWVAELHRSLLDSDAAAANAAGAEAARLAPSVMERLFLEEQLREGYKFPRREEMLHHGSEAWEAFSRLFGLIDFVARHSTVTGRVKTLIIERLDGVVTRAIDTGSTQDFEGLLTFLERSQGMRKGMGATPLRLFDGAVRRIFRGLHRLVMGSRKKLDPRVRLAHLMAQDVCDIYPIMTAKDMCDRLDAVVKDAKRLDLSGLAEQARLLRERLERAKDEPSGDDDEDIWDDDEDIWDDEDDDDDEFEGHVDRTAVEMQEMLAQLLEKLKNEVQRAQQTKKLKKPKKPKKVAKKAVAKKAVGKKAATKPSGDTPSNPN